MRNFYKYTDEQHIEVVTMADGMGETQTKTPVADVEALVDSGDAILYNTLTELSVSVQYASDRRNNYPPIEEQLDQIFHDGIDAWQETIQEVKDKHPKP